MHNAHMCAKISRVHEPSVEDAKPASRAVQLRRLNKGMSRPALNICWHATVRAFTGGM